MSPSGKPEGVAGRRGSTSAQSPRAPLTLALNAALQATLDHIPAPRDTLSALREGLRFFTTQGPLATLLFETQIHFAGHERNRL
jgi:hypothetical protein